MSLVAASVHVCTGHHQQGDVAEVTFYLDEVRCVVRPPDSTPGEDRDDLARGN